MSRVCKIVLVCEGWRDSAFARGFLTAAGIDGRSVDAKANPGGSGHNWVKSQFVLEVANLERFAEGRGVLGLLDEDGQGNLQREREIADHLKTIGLPPIRASDGRCLLLPTRNIETWLYWLAGLRIGSPVNVDETSDYNKAGPPLSASRIRNEDCRPAGEHLHTLDHTHLPAGCPPMLGLALERLREFLTAVRR